MNGIVFGVGNMKLDVYLILIYGMIYKMNQANLDFSQPEMTDTELHIYLTLDFCCHGEEKAMTGKTFEAWTGIPYKKIQATISHLVTVHEILIGSCNDGYYIPITPDEVKEACRPLMGRLVKLSRRISKLQKIAVEEVWGQARLEFTP